MEIGCGILAIWYDCAPEEFEGVEHWYLGEHLFERVSIAGFRCARRYRRVAGASEILPQYMTCYETETAGVLTSPEYLARVNDPTPGTHRAMTQVFQNMNRTICRRVAGAGAIRSSFAVAVVLDDGAAISLDDLPIPVPDTLWREVWVSAEPASLDMSEEERLRGRDAKVSACALIDCATQGDALTLADKIQRPGARVSVFELTFSLARADLP